MGAAFAELRGRDKLADETVFLAGCAGLSFAWAGTVCAFALQSTLDHGKIIGDIGGIVETEHLERKVPCVE